MLSCCSQSVESMALIVLYPEALNQHPGDAIDVLWLFLFSIPLGLMKPSF